MLPSLYSGISGLKANQRKLDVVGNNIANSSTTAFKSQRARFEDMISQSVSQASQATNTTGGVNGKQVGLGVQLAGIDTTTSQGSMQPTSRNLDFAIDGTGYFVVGTGGLPTDSAATSGNVITIPDPATHKMAGDGVTSQFTRDGSFTLDTQGNLLTSDGLRVYGYANTNVAITYATDVKTAHTVDITNPNAQNGADMDPGSTGALVPLVIPDSVTINGGTPVKVQSFSVGKDGIINAVLANGASAALGQIAMASFSNEAGLKKDGKNLYSSSANSGDPLLRSIAGDTTEDNSGGYGDVIQGCLEMSNVDLAEQFTDMIIASRAFQANGKIISTGDEILQDLVNLKR
ncbi:flagellar hook-basal body complex protein [Clostridiaceae bacterium UIB06]|uniref:Flagellar hook protein FlgE n=1 Tax=Clostridium thailandense TaxID=2794346 RepID=A0A949WU50_9CLOT|nr:flagellar hook-basal body complex protein [Clostridium thailandense]MBV7272212.1 flagellar hook-basal body complex protein [Clostridium thailandense]MCH5136503.1 flagellar hook-basal body complex protein [Clostridiaceae bacterium UIB06]